MIKHRSVHLRIKRNCLAYEARIIRKAENKALAYTRALRKEGKVPEMGAFWDLRVHRLDVVREEARSAHLAHRAAPMPASTVEVAA